MRFSLARRTIFFVSHHEDTELHKSTLRFMRIYYRTVTINNEDTNIACDIFLSWINSTRQSWILLNAILLGYLPRDKNIRIFLRLENCRDSKNENNNYIRKKKILIIVNIVVSQNRDTDNTRHKQHSQLDFFFFLSKEGELSRRRASVL